MQINRQVELLSYFWSSKVVERVVSRVDKCVAIRFWSISSLLENDNHVANWTIDPL